MENNLNEKFRSLINDYKKANDALQSAINSKLIVDVYDAQEILNDDVCRELRSLVLNHNLHWYSSNMDC